MRSCWTSGWLCLRVAVEMRAVTKALVLCAAVVMLPVAAYAQASIAGVAKDTSGAVLPGVTVEAASPALIEKIRTAVSDGAGQYRIIDLRPGLYTVTFTLPGFNTVKRDGIELAGNFVASVNVEMRVGALEETITVTGAAPVVDVQNTRQQSVMDRELVRDIPTSRQYYSIATLIPGIVVTGQQLDVGGSAPPSVPDFVIHGGRTGDGRLTVDGINVGQSGGSGEGANRTMFNLNVGSVQETTISTSGGLGESETAGVAINLVPRDGGNTMRGSFFTAYANGAFQGNNFTDELRARGLRTPNELKAVWEVTPMIGGPVLRDKLWYFGGVRHQGTRNWVAGMYFNKNAGDATKWTYEPDTSRRAIEDATSKSASLRLTFQASERNKVNAYWDEQGRQSGRLGGGSATTSPEAANLGFGNPNRVMNGTWSSPRTNRLLLEAGGGGTQLQFGGKEEPGYNRQLIRVTEQAGTIPGLSYRGQAETSNGIAVYQARGSVSYVTGTQNAKIGVLRSWYRRQDSNYDSQSLAYRFNNGVPNQITLNNAPRITHYDHNTLGIYAQDSFVLGRLTLQGGVRYDHMNTQFPEMIIGFNRFVPNGFIIPTTDGVHLNDITPRMAASYNLTGDGKTALKVTLGKYMLAQEYRGPWGVNLSPINRMPETVTRAWNDANRNFVPDCDLLNPVANGECGAYSNLNFGKNVAENSDKYDPALLTGWGIRAYNWEFGAQVQREVLPRVGVSAGYFRRWYGNFVVTDNRALGPDDFDAFSISVPADSRLPNGGGYTLDGFRDVKPAKFGLTNNLVTSSKNYGNRSEYWQGFDVSVNARAVNGLTASGGFSTGRWVVEECEIAKTLPEMFQRREAISFSSVVGTVAAPLSKCRVQEPFWGLAQLKGLASYVVPRLDVQVSATYQNSPGAQLSANFNASNAVVASSLGRNLAGNAANVAINLAEPGSLYGERINLLDLRVAKVLAFGRARTNLALDLYNSLNNNVPTGYNQTFGASYLTPTQIMPARFIKLNLQVDW